MNQQAQQSFTTIIDLALRQGGLNALAHANICIEQLDKFNTALEQLQAQLAASKNSQPVDA